MRCLKRAVLPGLLVAMLSGCGITGLGERPLPFTKGNGEGSLTVHVVLENAVNLVPNSEVKVNDVTVGSVRSISFRDWRAVAEVGLEPGVSLPANTTARIGQKSLLGAEYLELAAPARALGELKDGSTIPVQRTGRYPETEEVLAAMSQVLNGAGLGQVGTITTELNQVLGGREGDVRELVARLNSFVGRLNRQKESIIQALEGLNRVSGTMNEDRAVLVEALETMPKAIDTLSRERPRLTRLLRDASAFGTRAQGLLAGTRTDLQRTLESLQPALKGLADAEEGLTTFLGAVTFPFPTDGLLASARGDYLNLFVTVDVTLEAISRDWTAGTPLEGVYSGLTGQVPQPPSTQDSDLLGDLPELPGLSGPSRSPKLPLLSGKSSGSSDDGSPGQLDGGLLSGLFGGLG